MKRETSLLKVLVYLIIGLYLLQGCKKDQPATLPEVLDVASQWVVDNNGVVVSALTDGQWSRKALSNRELALFNNLDTVSLAGTTTAQAILDTTTNLHPFFPNPFQVAHQLTFAFNPGIMGDVILKAVVVDSTYAIKYQTWRRISTQSTMSSLQVTPSLSTGKYRFYFTLSTQAAPHFYTSWGNIEKQ